MMSAVFGATAARLLQATIQSGTAPLCISSAHCLSVPETVCISASFSSCRCLTAVLVLAIPSMVTDNCVLQEPEALDLNVTSCSLCRDKAASRYCLPEKMQALLESVMYRLLLLYCVFQNISHMARKPEHSTAAGASS